MAQGPPFRRLQTNLQFLDVGGMPKTIVVTSAVSGEGKSTTAINLAITLADSGARVALVDADLRRPSVAEYMGLEGGVGLTTVLIGQAAVADVIQPWGEGTLHVLPSGQIPPNPSKLLRSRPMADLLQELTSRYDIVIIDTPPLLPVTDAAILAKLTGGALVVIGAGQLHRQQLEDALGSLETVGAPVLGLVLNRLAHKQGDTYSYYDYASAPGTAAKRKKHRRAATSDSAEQSPAPARERRSSPRSNRPRDEGNDTIEAMLGTPAPTQTGRRSDDDQR